MKTKPLFLFFALMLTMSSCSTFQYTARQVDIDGRNLSSKQQAAGLQIDFSRQVTATSEYQVSKRDAMKEAEFKCLQENKIDVIVDPVFKFEYNPLHFKTRWKATVVGYAAKYEEKPAGVDATKPYTREEIENYRLLTDPTFPMYFYNHGTGDNYYFNSVSTKKKPEMSSLIVKDVIAPQTPVKFDFDKSKKLRDAGIGLICGGVVSMIAIGTPCFIVGNSYYYDDYYDRYRCDYDALAAGITFLSIGGAAIVAGIPMLSVGACRMKKSNNTLDFSIGTSGTGLSVGVKF